MAKRITKKKIAEAERILLERLERSLARRGLLLRRPRQLTAETAGLLAEVVAAGNKRLGVWIHLSGRGEEPEARIDPSRIVSVEANAILTDPTAAHRSASAKLRRAIERAKRTAKKKAEPTPVTDSIRLGSGEWIELFLTEFRECGIVRRAAKVAEVSRSVVYDRLETDEAFRQVYNEAKEDSIERLEDRARDRAERDSDTLLIFLLKSLRPEVYRENHKVEHHFPDLSELSDYELEQIVKTGGAGRAGAPPAKT